MNLEIARQRYKDVFLPDVIDNSQGDFLAKHVPMKTLYFTDHADLTEDDKSNPYSESELYEQIFSDELTEDQFILVKGASGAGKSHLIRWFDTMLEVRKPEDEIVLYIRRADNTLKGTIRQLINLPEVQNLPNKDLYKKLASASTTVPEIELKNTIYYSFVNFIDSDDGRDEETDERIIGNVDRKHLIALLQNSHFKEKLMENSGPIDRIYTKIAENKKFEVNDQAAKFEVEDFEIDADFRSELIKNGADSKARKLVDKMLDNEEFISRLIFYINRFVEKVVQRCTGLEPGDLRDVIEEIRHELYLQKKELTILIEDITAASGVDDSLLDALLTNKSGYTDKNLCRIRSIVGVADGYYRENFRSNTKGRIKQFINVPDDLFYQDSESLIEFFAKYLNTVSLPIEAIDQWIEEKANPDFYPIHNVTVGDGWDEFELGDKYINLYPYTKNAILNLFKAQEISQRNPRAIMRNLIEPIVKEAIDGLTDFPKDYISTSLLPEIANKNFDTATAYRLSRFIQIWGDGTTNVYTDNDIRYISGIPEKIFIELNLPILDGKVIEKPVEREIEPASDHEKEPEFVQPLENPEVSDALKEVDRWIENEEHKLSIGATTKNVRALTNVRKDINDYLFNVIDWISEGVPVDAMIKIRDTSNKFLVTFERQTTKSDALVLLPASIESRKVIESFLKWRLIGKQSWNFPGSTDYLYRVQRWVDSIKPMIINAMMSYHGKQVNYFSYAVAADYYRMILNGHCKKYSSLRNLTPSLLLQQNPAQKEDNTHSTSWNKLQQLVNSPDGEENRKCVLQYFNLPQGTSISSKNYEIDYPRFKNAVDKVLATGLKFEDSDLQLDDPVRKRRISSEYLKKILDRISIVVEEEKKMLQEDLKTIDDLLGLEDLDKEMISDAVKVIKKFYEKGQDSHISATMHVDNTLINECSKKTNSISTAIQDARDIISLTDDVEDLLKLSKNPLGVLSPFVALIRQAASDITKAKNEISNRMHVQSPEETDENEVKYKVEREQIKICKEKIEEVRHRASNGGN